MVTAFLRIGAGLATADEYFGCQVNTSTHQLSIVSERKLCGARCQPYFFLWRTANRAQRRPWQPPRQSLNGSPGCTAPACHHRPPSASIAVIRALDAARRGLLLGSSNRRPSSEGSRERRQRLWLPPDLARASRHRAQPCDALAWTAWVGTSNDLGKAAGFHPPTFRFK